MNDPGEGGWLLHGMLNNQTETKKNLSVEENDLRKVLVRAKQNILQNPAEFLERESKNTSNSESTRLVLSSYIPAALFNKKFNLIGMLNSFIQGREQNIKRINNLKYDYRSELNKEKRKTFLTCWHKKTPANQAMWGVYGAYGASVAVQTTTEKLDSCINDFNTKRSNQYWVKSTGEVTYLDESDRENLQLQNEILKKFAIDPTANFKFKSEPYQYENEYRGIIKWDGKNIRKEKGIKAAINQEFIESIYIDPRSNESSLLNIAVKEINFKFDLSHIPILTSDIDPCFL